MVSGWLGVAALVLAAMVAPSAAAQMGDCDCGDMKGSMWSQWWGRFGTGVALGVGGTVAGVTGWFGWRRGWWSALIPVALFSRFERDEMERHPGRATIMDALRGEPGLTTPQLASRAGMNVGTLLYHLRALEAHGIVRSARVGRERGWWESGPRAPDPGELATLRSPVRYALLETIGLIPGLTQVELAKRMSRSKATTHHHLEELVRAGFVEARPDGRVVRYFPRPASSPAWPAMARAASAATGTVPIDT